MNLPPDTSAAKTSPERLRIPILIKIVLALIFACLSAYIHLWVWLLWPPRWKQMRLRIYVIAAFSRTLFKVIKAYQLQQIIGSRDLESELETPFYYGIVNTSNFNVQASSKCRWIHEVENRTPDDPVIYYMHGGGFALGIVFPQIYWLRALTTRLESSRVSVLALDYTLAPQAKYPTQLNEALNGYEALAHTCNRIITLGDSAGGQLSAALAMKIYGTDLHARLFGQIFVSPWVELLPAREGSVAKNKSLDWVCESFAANCAEGYTGIEVDWDAGKFKNPSQDEFMDIGYASPKQLTESLANKKACIWSRNEMLADACERFVHKANITQRFAESGTVHDIMYFGIKNESFKFAVATLNGWLK